MVTIDFKNEMINTNDLPIGTTFIYGDTLYMRIYETASVNCVGNTVYFNAVSLKDGVREEIIQINKRDIVNIHISIE